MKSQTYRVRHRALGLCLECPKVAKKDRTRCHACLMKRSACALKRRQRMDAAIRDTHIGGNPRVADYAEIDEPIVRPASDLATRCSVFSS